CAVELTDDRRRPCRVGSSPVCQGLKTAMLTTQPLRCFVLQSTPLPHTAPVHPPAAAGGCTSYASSSLETSRPADWSRVARLSQRLRRKLRTSCFCRSSSASKFWITALASDGPN